MGLTERDLYYNSFEKFLSKNREIKSLDKEIQEFKYQKYEENRKKFIEEAKKTRKELKKKQKIQKNMKKSFSTSFVQTQGEKKLNNEKIRLDFYQKQQIGELLNIIEREYKRTELEKKLENQENLRIQREEEIRKMRKKGIMENAQRDKLQMLKMEQHTKKINDELIRKEKKREEEEKKLMIKNELRKKEEEKERKERQNEIKLKEEEFQRRLDNLYKLQIKKRNKMEKQLLLKEEIQKKNLEEIKNKKDKEIKARVRSTDEKIQKCSELIKLKDDERNKKNELLYYKKNKLIEEKLNLQKELDKKLLHQRLVQSALKREEIEENIKRKERILELNRLKLLNEIEEKDKRINLVKSKKLELWEKQKQLSKDFEENRRKLLKRFNLIMAKRNNKTKDEIIQEIFDDNDSYKIMKRNKPTLNISSTNKSENIINNNKMKDHIFLTNLSLAGLNGYKNKSMK